MFDAGDAAKVLAWVIVFFFAVSVQMKAISRSRPERFVVTPFVLMLALLAAIIAKG